MLTTLSTLKTRLAIDQADPQYDPTLTAALTALGARFDKETSRTLARTENFTQEFDAASTEILAACCPIETVTKFESKTSEVTGWQEITPPPTTSSAAAASFLCHFHSALRTPHSAFATLAATSFPVRLPPPAKPHSPQVSKTPPWNKSPSGSKTATTSA